MRKLARQESHTRKHIIFRAFGSINYEKKLQAKWKWRKMSFMNSKKNYDAIVQWF